MVDPQPGGGNTMPTVPRADSPWLPDALIDALPKPTRSPIDATFGTSVQEWSSDPRVVVRSVEARVLRSIRDEEFDLSLIRDDDLLS